VSSSFTYAKAGVDREQRAKSKAALKTLEQTYKHSHYGEVIQLPYGNIFPVGEKYFDLAIEGVGTKVLLAQLANKYDTIGIDAVALAANDVIRSGAKPLAVADNIHAHVSNPNLVAEWIKSIAKGADEAGCIVPSGEIGDVADVIKGMSEGIGFDMVVACIGELGRSDIIFGNNIKSGDAVIGLRSSGIHSNGITLARKILFKQWGGKYEPFEILEGFDRELVYEVLEPMAIYVKPFVKAAKKYEIRGAVHITGDAYLKFDKLMLFSKEVGFEFDSFRPQPIFGLIQKVAEEIRVPITDEEMLKTFNMGWGFAVVVDKNEKDAVMNSFERDSIHAEQIGQVTYSKKIVAIYKGKKILLK
jgi:phosphoribosylformylglycinamidine cyclo-ligase